MGRHPIIPPVILEDQTLRDGLQGEHISFSIEEKIHLFRLLAACGIGRIQVGSFVHPKLTPQMADTDELIRRLPGSSGDLPVITALVLNEKGLDRALDTGIRDLSISLSISETHSRSNTGQTPDEALERNLPLIRRAAKNGIRVRAGIQCAFGDAETETMDMDRLTEFALRLMDAGASELGLADTPGLATPADIRRVTGRIFGLFGGDGGGDLLSLHLHDTGGMGMANLMAGFEAGIRKFDAAAGGLGGCPFLANAAGNIATEDAVRLLESLGADTGIRIKDLAPAIRFLEKKLDRPLPGRACRVFIDRILPSTGSRSAQQPSPDSSNARSLSLSKGTTPLPLHGIRILEFTHTVMGPVCGMVLADMGAEVIRVERPGGDDTQRLTGFGAGFYPLFNRNKGRIIADLKSEEGKQEIREKIRKSDVLIENFAPGTMDRLGLGWEDCRAINPGLIYCTLKGFMPGPYAHRAALDEVVQMMGGLAYMTGPPGKPMRAGASVTDILGGSYGVIGILAALRDRDATGNGRLVTASLYESVAFLMAQHMAAEAVSKTPAPPMSARARSWAVYDLFETADGSSVFIGITSDRHWQRFCAEFGFEEWSKDEQLGDNQGRLRERDRIMPAMEDRLKKMPAAEIMEKAEAAAIPFAPVGTPSDLFTDPHLQSSGGLMEIPFPDGDMIPLPKIPVRLDGMDFGYRKGPPGPESRDVGFSQEKSPSDTDRP